MNFVMSKNFTIRCFLFTCISKPGKHRGFTFNTLIEMGA